MCASCSCDVLTLFFFFSFSSTFTVASKYFVANARLIPPSLKRRGTLTSGRIVGYLLGAARGGCGGSRVSCRVSRARRPFDTLAFVASRELFFCSFSECKTRTFLGYCSTATFLSELYLPSLDFFSGRTYTFTASVAQHEADPSASCCRCFAWRCIQI